MKTKQKKVKVNKTDADIVDSVTTIDTEGLLAKAKEKYASKYSDQLSHMIEDNARLERALKFTRQHIKSVTEGDVFAIEEYMQARKRLENDTNY